MVATIKRVIEKLEEADEILQGNPDGDLKEEVIDSLSETIQGAIDRANGIFDNLEFGMPIEDEDEFEEDEI